MAIQAGLVGLPNVGKSTLFNALTKSAIPAENYPFCTIDPHVALTAVPDERLTGLAALFSSQKIVPTHVQFVDIAGLVKGAASGEGLGNQFLSNVMGVDLILHVLRCFDDADITHVHDRVDPISDFETIVTELCLKDLESIEKRQQKIVMLIKKAHHSDPKQIKGLEAEDKLLQEVIPLLETGDIASINKLITAARDEHNVTTIHLLTAKNFLLIANVSEDEFSGQAYKSNQAYQQLVDRFGAEKVIAVSAKIEAELAQLEDEEAQEMMESLEITEKGLDNIIRAAYSNLGMMTFFTCGPKEAHAWQIKYNTKVPQAAGTIHSDLERGFICAEVYHCDDMFAHGSESALKNAGKIRTEGKEYLVQDGDVLNIRFNV